MNKFWSILLLLPLAGRAQQTPATLAPETAAMETEVTTNRGIRWTEGLSWAEVKEKAKAENMYIFLDLYTTWCGPCKMMDNQVYPNDSVGAYFNSRFVSVKVQMDQTKKDNEWVKGWYNDAANLGAQYRINGYPAFLFFTPEGTMVHKDGGAILDIPKFIAVAQSATVPGKVYVDPHEIYNNLVARYKKGEVLYDSLPFMIYGTDESDTALRRALTQTHVDRMLSLPPAKRYIKENIFLWSSLSLTTQSPLFNFFLRDGKQIDKAVGRKDFSVEVIDKTIQRTIVVPFYDEQNKNKDVSMSGYYVNGANLPTYTTEAEWKKLKQLIQQQVKSYDADRSVLTARIEWYKRLRNHNAYTEAFLAKMEKYPPESVNDNNVMIINDFAWNTFLHVTDKSILIKAADWSKKTVQKYPKFHFLVDTYACLLYKAGKKEDAVNWQEKALALAPTDFGVKNNLEIMKRGEKIPGAVWE